MRKKLSTPEKPLKARYLVLKSRASALCLSGTACAGMCVAKQAQRVLVPPGSHGVFGCAALLITTLVLENAARDFSTAAINSDLIALPIPPQIA
jgi:hypothetical protein